MPRTNKLFLAVVAAGSVSAAVLGGGAAFGAPDAYPAAKQHAKKYDKAAVREGQALPADQPLLLADHPDSGLALVGYRDDEGAVCLGFVESAGTGLPSSCDPKASGRDKRTVRAAQGAEVDAAGVDVGPRTAYGSVPAKATTVRLEGEFGVRTVQVSRPTDAATFDQGYFLVVLPTGSGAVESFVALDADGKELARQ